MECIKCGYEKSNKEAGLCDRGEKREMANINGILYVPAMGLIISVIKSPLGLYNYFVLILRFYHVNNTVPPIPLTILMAYIISTLICFFAAESLFLRKKRAPKIMITYYVNHIIVNGTLIFFVTVILGNALTHEAIFEIVPLVTAVCIWIPYFIFSKRLKDITKSFSPRLGYFFMILAFKRRKMLVTGYLRSRAI